MSLSPTAREPSSTPFGVTAADLFSQAPRRRWWQRATQVAPVRIVIGFLFVVPGTFVEPLVGQPDSLGAQLAASVGTSALFLLLFAAFALLVERRRPRELSPRHALPEWLVGFAGGIALVAATVGLLAIAGLYRVRAGGDARALLVGIAQFGPHALLEEILLRAIVFKITEESIGSRLALGIQAALFGAMHLGNPSASLGAGIAIMLEAGLLLAVTYVVTRRMWLAWGVHLGWNYAQGSVFGIHVSGITVTSSLLVSTPDGPEAITGGSFGVEASPFAVVVCLAATALLWRFAVRRGEVLAYRDQRDRLRALRAALVSR